jgi:peptide/nickel transport system ATP-binding protein
MVGNTPDITAAGKTPGKIAATGEVLLEIEDLHVEFQTINGVVKVIDGVDLRIHRGESVALVGESGSGKSVTAMSILRLLREPPARISGSIRLHHRDRSAVTELARSDLFGRELQSIRGREIAMIFQEPMRALSPVFTVGHQVAEAIWLHQNMSKTQAWAEAVEGLDRVGIPEPARAAQSYPHSLSGGQLQRVMIAMALACKPALLIADEPTTALDVTIQAQILELMKDLQESMNLAVLLITHDLGVVAGFCSSMNVMYMGQIVERGPIHQVFESPAQPYTQGLLKSITVPGQNFKERFPSIRGSVPDPMDGMPEGCAFGPRCDLFEKGICDRPGRVPPVEIGPGHTARCYRTELAGR